MKNNKEKNTKKEKVKYVEDDGRTLYDMSGITKPSIFKSNKKKKVSDNLMITKKERKAMIKAAFEAYLPMLLMFVIGFSLAALLLYLLFKR